MRACVLGKGCLEGWSGESAQSEGTSDDLCPSLKLHALAITRGVTHLRPIMNGRSSARAEINRAPLERRNKRAARERSIVSGWRSIPGVDTKGNYNAFVTELPRVSVAI